MTEVVEYEDWYEAQPLWVRVLIWEKQAWRRHEERLRKVSNKEMTVDEALIESERDIFEAKA